MPNNITKDVLEPFYKVMRKARLSIFNLSLEEALTRCQRIKIQMAHLQDIFGDFVNCTPRKFEQHRKFTNRMTKTTCIKAKKGIQLWSKKSEYLYATLLWHDAPKF